MYRDSVSGVIFNVEFCDGDDEDKAGICRDRDEVLPDLENHNDTQRRIEAFKPLFTEKKVVDYGCGRGSFLRSVERSTLTASGVELQENFRKALETDGIRCVGSPGKLVGQEHAVFKFRVLEHVLDPLSSLLEIRELVRSFGVSILLTGLKILV